MSDSVQIDNDSRFQIELLCKNIQSPERLVRQKALKQFLELVTQEPELNNDHEVFNAAYLYIIKCYGDKYESCRSLAAEIISQLITTINGDNTNELYLDYVIPVLRRRIGQKEIIEDSEELRLQLMEQLYEIVNKFHYNECIGDCLMKSYNDIMDIMMKCLTDPYAAVQRQCCKVIQLLATATPSFYAKAELLISPLISLLSHRHSGIRVIAIETLGRYFFFYFHYCFE